MPEIVCNEFGRIVSVNGRTDVLHNTDVLNITGASKDYSAVDPFYAERGNAIHLGIKLLNDGVLDESSLDPEIKPYIDDYKKVLADNPDLEIVASEIACYSVLHDFCTTIDLIVKYKGQLELWDVKSGKSIDPSVEIQTGGCQIAWEENNRPHLIKGRRYLKICGDGDPKIGPDHSHVPTYLFLDVLAFCRWKLSHKRKIKPPFCEPSVILVKEYR